MKLNELCKKVAFDAHEIGDVLYERFGSYKYIISNKNKKTLTFDVEGNQFLLRKQPPNIFFRYKNRQTELLR